MPYICQCMAFHSNFTCFKPCTSTRVPYSKASTVLICSGTNSNANLALGSGACRSPFAHSDPAVLAAIAAIEDPFVRRYAEQRCTEASLQRLLRENPAHAYFKDRLNELYDESIEGRLAMEIGKLHEYARATNEILNSNLVMF